MRTRPSRPPSPPGFYDIQTIHERKGQVAGIRWVEHVLVQRYPDEYGRHLQVLNLNAEFGALQIRPAPNEVGRGARLDRDRASARRRGPRGGQGAAGRNDLIMVLPAGRYDIRVSLGDRSTTWIRDVDIPADQNAPEDVERRRSDALSARIVVSSSEF